MKRINFFFLLFLVTIGIFSCDEGIKTHSLVLKIDAVIQESDSINVYYNTTNSIDFTKSKSFWTKIKGSKKNQMIQIEFPDSVKPKQIRLDFGKNIYQKDIVINKISIAYKNKSITLQAKEIFYTFRVDENNTVFDKLNGSIRKKVPNQKNGPSLYPKGDKLYKKLNNLYYNE